MIIDKGHFYILVSTSLHKGNYLFIKFVALQMSRMQDDLQTEHKEIPTLEKLQNNPIILCKAELTEMLLKAAVNKHLWNVS